MKKNIAILGSTGSIGRQTLEVIKSLGPDYNVVALTANSNHQLLAEQVRDFKPELAVLTNDLAAEKLSGLIDPQKCRIESGSRGQLIAAGWPTADFVVMAMVGFCGFEPLVSSLKNGKTVALANKESLVIGGEILKRMNLLNREKLLPVDSEHSAIWQCWGNASPKMIRKVIITASGGPFWDWDPENLDLVTPEDALNHPTWKMGKKISVDSATMINKGLEVIEAKWLFDLELDQIEVLIHRQSIVHSMVEYIDGSIIAQIGMPDMRLPIQHALTFPERCYSPVENIDLFSVPLTFDQPNHQKFPCLNLAFSAAKSGGTMPACLNGANEAAVTEFLAGKIKFTEIPEIIKTVISEHQIIETPEIKDIVSADRWSRQKAEQVIADLKGGVN